MNPLPAYFDLDSDQARREAFGRELDRIDEQHQHTGRLPVAKAARKQVRKTGRLYAETAHTDALAPIAAETKDQARSRRRLSIQPNSGLQQKSTKDTSR